MAQNITLLGASYSDVPSVLLPKTGGGQASFTDVTDTTAAAADVAQGKYFYTSAGVRTEGTSTGGGGTEAGTVTQDANGFLVLDDDPPAGPTLITKSITANGTYNASSDSADGYSSVTVNVSGGGGGLVYESGTLTPTEDIARPVINFSNTHANMPSFVLISDVDDTVASADSGVYFTIVNWFDCFGVGLKGTATNVYYARVQYGYKTSSGITQSGYAINQYDSAVSTNALGYYLSNSSFSPYLGSASRYFRSGTTYKWVAVWEPTS